LSELGIAYLAIARHWLWMSTYIHVDDVESLWALLANVVLVFDRLCHSVFSTLIVAGVQLLVVKLSLLTRDVRTGPSLERT